MGWGWAQHVEGEGGRCGVALPASASCAGASARVGWRRDFAPPVARAQPSATPAYKPLALAEPQRLAQPQLLLLAVVAVAVAAAKEPHGLVSRPIG